MLGYDVMRKNLLGIFLTIAVALSLGNQAQAAPSGNQYFRSEGGGYRLTLPPGSRELYHTSTGVRFVVGDSQLVSGDLYSLPNFLSVPLRQYSLQQQKELASFIKKAQDYSDFVFEAQPKSAALVTIASKANKEGSLKSRLEALQKEAALKNAASDNKTKASATEANFMAKQEDNSLEFALQAPTKSNLKRNYVLGRAYQVGNDKLFVLTITSPQGEKLSAKQGLVTLTKDLRLGKPMMQDTNTLTSELLGLTLNLPAGWHGYTLQADNVLWARSISSVHNDSAMIRAFHTKEFSNLAEASSADLPKAEADFLQKITKFTPNISIVRHEPLVLDGLNGSLIHSTDSDDLKKVFVLTAYLFSPEGVGYQIRFSTDDTINYAIKLQSFTTSLKSFKRVAPVNNLKN